MSFLAENKKKDDLIMISWFKKQRDPDTPSLIIVFKSGLIQLMRNENDNGERLLINYFINIDLMYNFLSIHCVQYSVLFFGTLFWNSY